jgi:hypothetical protein
MPDATVGWFPVVTPVVTLLLGYALKSVSELVGHRRTLQREREAREVTRRDKFYERRTDFQRQTLLDLQEAMSDLIRSTGAAHHQDTMAYRQTGKWQKHLLGEVLDESCHKAMRRTLILWVRVQDDSVREMVQRCRECASKVMVGPNKEDSDVALANMAKIFEELNPKIGELIRTIDVTG